jgi:hypothetical protein
VRDTVEFVCMKTRMVPYDRKDAFSFRKDRPAQWLQKLCLYTLRKLGAFDIGEKEVVKHYTLKPRLFMERLYKQREYLFSQFDREPSCLLIGAGDFEEMMGMRDIHQYLSFTGEYNRGHEIIGLKVHIVPWMKGFIVLPKGIV